MNDDVLRALAWMRKAGSDLDTARERLRGPGPYDTACFHAQQAAEKALKAVLASHGQEILFTHDLGELRLAILAIRPDFAADEVELDRLTPNAVALRYDLDFWPELTRAANYVAMAERVHDVVSRILAPIPAKDSDPATDDGTSE